MQHAGSSRENPVGRSTPRWDDLTDARSSNWAGRRGGLDWDRFGEGLWETLARIYEGLPGAVRHRDVPRWFGDDGDVPPFLWASVEPPGLQVHDVLPEADWWAWDERSREVAAGLPCRVRQ